MDSNRLHRAALLERLELDLTSPASLFATIWSYFDDNVAVGLRRLNNAVRSRGIGIAQIDSLRAWNKPGLLDELKKLSEDPNEFDIFSMRWLKAIDHRLNNETDLPDNPLEGLNESKYWIRHRNNPLASRYSTIERTAGPQTQGGIVGYIRRCVAIVVPSSSKIQLVFQKLPPAIQHFLQQDDDAGRYRVLIWPFADFDFDFPSLRESREHFVRLDRIENEDDLIVNVCSAIDEARKLNATVLVFPELSFSPNAEESMVKRLKENGGGKTYPLLTVFGRCHYRESQPEGLDINEAVIVGPDGEELLVHRKLTCFDTPRPITLAGKTWPNGFGERIKTGNELVLLETPIGVVAAPICLDLCEADSMAAISASHANTLFVPSLSVKTTAHADAAKALRVKQFASCFVSNRALDSARNPQNELDFGASFYEICRPKDARVVHNQDNPYLLFDADSWDGTDSD